MTRRWHKPGEGWAVGRATLGVDHRPFMAAPLPEPRHWGPEPAPLPTHEELVEAALADRRRQLDAAGPQLRAVMRRITGEPAGPWEATATRAVDTRRKGH